jgi:ribosome-associated heat shock protein Hsp15
MTDAGSLRLDKWLWYARFFKSRSLATQFCNAGKLRVDGAVVAKAHHLVRPGNVLTFVRGAAVRVVRVVSLGSRRGPATEAKALYEDLSPPMPPRKEAEPVPGERDPGSGRPTKRDRRALDKLRGT